MGWPAERPFKLAITGGVHAGKTTRARGWIQSLNQLGFICFGCLEVAVLDGDGNRLGYDFEDIRTHERRPFARINPTGIQGYSFDDTVWPWFESAYTRIPPKAIAVFDELGKLEAAGEGMMIFVKDFLSHHQDICGMAAVCRQSVWKEICVQLGGWDWIDHAETN